MKRIIIKLSGESLSNKEKGLAIDPEILHDIGRQIVEIQKKDVEIGIVVGGGNFWRGAPAGENGLNRNRADYMGMLATIMNGLALQSAFEKFGLKVRVQSALAVDPRIAENYVNEKADKALEEKEIVIFTGGIGRPFFTTDTTAVSVANELNVNTILMGKNGVDGVYDSDPKTNPNAKHYETISYNEIISLKLKVMDATAALMGRDNKITLFVFDITEKDSLIKAIDGNIKMTKVN